MVKANSVQWYSHILRKEDKYVIIKALEFEMQVVEEDDDQNEYEKTHRG